MTSGQRAHGVHLLDQLYVLRTGLLYPPHDVRTSLDVESWDLTEAELLARLKHGGKVQFDCSEFCPWVLKCVRAWPWSQPGATSSHVENPLLTEYTDGRDAFPLALVVFGEGGGHHEAIVHTPDHVHGDPLIDSHGLPGLERIRVSEEAARQAAMGHPGVRYLSVAHLP